MSEAEQEDSSLQDLNLAISNRVTMERNIRVAQTAQKAFDQNKGKFEIRLRIPTGEKSTNILGSEEIQFKEGEYETKSFKFKKISTNDWNLLLRTRAELNNEMVKPVGEADNIKINDLTTRIYEYLALKFLGMRHDDFIRAEWDDVKLAIDVCSFITESGNKEIELAKVEDSLVTTPLIPDKFAPLEAAEPPTQFDEQTLKLNKRTVDSSPKKYYEYEG